MKITVLLIFLPILINCGTNNKNKRQLTKSSIVTGKDTELQEHFIYFESYTPQDSIIIKDEALKWDSDDKLDEILFINHSDTIKSKVERTGYTSAIGNNIFVDMYHGIGYISWISEPNYDEFGTNNNHRYELYLKSIDLKTGKDFFNTKIYSTRCCIKRLSMKYNPFTSSVLFSYNDYSKDNSNFLMFGAIKLKNNQPIVKDLSPREILSQDQSEKREPQFLMDKRNVYIYHSSGDNWGFFEHTGIAQIGLSKIDDKNLPYDYKILSDSCAIETRLLLINDSIFYRIRVSNRNKPDEMILKKAALKDLMPF